MKKTILYMAFLCISTALHAQDDDIKTALHDLKTDIKLMHKDLSNEYKLLHAKLETIDANVNTKIEAIDYKLEASIGSLRTMGWIIIVALVIIIGALMRVFYKLGKIEKMAASRPSTEGKLVAQLVEAAGVFTTSRRGETQAPKGQMDEPSTPKDRELPS